MTSMSTMHSEEANEERKSSAESSMTPEEWERYVKEGVTGEARRFASETEERLAGTTRMEEGLPSQDVAAMRASAHTEQLPNLIQEADALAKQTLARLNQPPVRRVASSRLQRALGIAPASLPEIEIEQTPAREEAAETVAADTMLAFEQTVHERQSQERIRPEVFRLQRDLNLADAVERLEQGDRLEQKQVEMIVGALEGRGWQRLFNNVKPGDAIASFLVPNAEYFSIKQFNDVLFGMQKTDDIIKMRRDLLLQEAETLGLERVATSYKDEYYRIPHERLLADGESGMKAELMEAAERMRFQLTAKLTELAAIEWEEAEETRKAQLDRFVRSMIGEKGFEQYTEQRTILLSARRAWQKTVQDEAVALQQTYAAARDAEGKRQADADYEHAKELATASYQLLERQRHTMNTEAVVPALKEDHRLGYRMTFGMNEVGEAKEGDLTHIERAVAESLKGAMLARRRTENGSQFSKEDAEAAVKRVSELREEIGIQDLTDADGRVYPVFEFRPDGGGKMVSILNLDLIQEIRKGTFKPVEDAKQAKLFQTVKSYIEAINIFDTTKPYLHSEIAGKKVYGTEQTIGDHLEESRYLALRLREASISSEEKVKLAALLRQDGKDRACSSTMEFHRKALTISNCSYISLDVLNVGPELLQEYELLLQRVANGRLSFDEAQLIAGDATTEKMRQFRSRVTEAYRELCHGEEPIMSVGGDEVVLAMDTAKITDAFMLKLRQIKLDDRNSGRIRVVKTAIGTGERMSASDGETRMQEHLEAIKRAEEGTAIAKRMEKLIREIRGSINDLPEMDRQKEMEQLDGLNMSEFAVHEREQAGTGFELILRDPEHSEQTIRANLEAKEEELKHLSARLHQTVELRRKSFYDELKGSHPSFPKELIPIALRRKDRSEQSYDVFIKAFS